MIPLRKGLVSISFRNLSPEEIIELAVKCGLEEIEWGGDVHVPCGDLKRAREVGEMTRARGLKVACYGSYCRMTDEEANKGMLEHVVHTAYALGAPLIRVWAGKTGSSQATAAQRDEIVQNTRRMNAIAAGGHMDIAFEYHGGTLTDTVDSAEALLDAINLERVGCLWQPPVGMSAEKCAESIRRIGRYIRNIHTFSWNGTERLPLAEGTEKWRVCLDEIQKLSGDPAMLLEFVRGDDPAQLKADAACLSKWLEGVAKR